MNYFKGVYVLAIMCLDGSGTVQAQTDVYIVQMRDNPVIAYSGDITRFTATKPGRDHKINPNSAHVKKYVRHLESTHDHALAAGRGDSQEIAIEFTVYADVVLNEWTFGALTWTNDGGASDARSPIAIRPVQALVAPG